MGNKSNRAPRRTRRRNIKNLLNWMNNQKRTAAGTESNDISTDAHTVVVDFVSILNAASDVQHNTATTVTNVQDVFDPLLVVKSEEDIPLISDEQSDDLTSVYHSQDTSVGSIITKLEVEPISNEAVISEPSNSTAFKNMCRLCLAKDEGHWIDIFSNESYDGCDDITPSNIVEIIEQCTSVKISNNDHLPIQLCDQCFLSLRFVHKFRQKSIRSQSTLGTMVNASSQENEQENRVVNATNSQPIKKVIKVIHLKPLRKSVFYAKRNPTTYPTVKRTDTVEREGKNTGDVQCELCGKVFENSKLLQYHLNRHNDVRPFACTEPFCDKSFYSPSNLKSHIFNVHSIDPKYKCDLCEKAYTKAEKLKLHRTIHFPPTIPCTICGKLLRNRTSVYKHRKSHTERLFRCDDCGKAFQNVYTLRVHRRIHTNEKPFICCKCGEAFAYNCLLKAHTERKHSE